MKILLRLYPQSWREEYGPELENMLQSRPLTAGVVANVIWNALRERLHTGGLPTIAGLVSALVVVTGLVWNIVSPPADPFSLTAILRDSVIGDVTRLPRLVVFPISSPLFFLMLMYVGYRVCRFGGTVRQSGRAAAKVAAIAGIPVMLAGVLMAAGGLGMNSHHGLTYTYFLGYPHRYLHPNDPSPGWLSVFVAPLFAIPQCWLWGVMGGALGRRLKKWCA